mmetsp:Transcript_6453/g.12917  ORF Transcript_6453/g.12917 Transcript_6453/m.12917 type:complete len:352 (+) Transcript_6453:194-1249(+)
MPAAFGEPWEDSSVVLARLYYLTERPQLCPLDDTSSKSNNNDAPIFAQSSLSTDTNKNNDYEATTTTDLPVALLVDRGDCSFIEKAVQASQEFSVQYLIIADNRADESIIRMSGPHFDGLAPVMISQASGTALKQLLQKQQGDSSSAGTTTSGLVIELHGLFLPNHEDPTKAETARQFFLDMTPSVVILLVSLSVVWCLSRHQRARLADLKRAREARPFIHAGHTCDGCACRPIHGKRYHAVATDVDYCETCYRNMVTTATLADEEGHDTSCLQWEEAKLDRDVHFQDSWYMYRVLAGIDPLPEEGCPIFRKKKTDVKDTKDASIGDAHDDATVELSEDEALLVLLDRQIV